MEVLKRLDNGSILALVNLDKIRTHEDIKEDYLRKLTGYIEEADEVYRPILVASKDFVILDGHHRFFSCKALGCKRITCILVDYSREDITVSTWSPLILDDEEAKNALRIISENGFRVDKVETETKMQSMINSGTAAFGIVMHDSPLEFYIAKSVTKGEDAKTFSNAMKPIVKDIQSRGKLESLQYMFEDDKARELVVSGEAKMLIKIPIVSKESVIQTGYKEEKYPPKTTKHFLPEVQDYHVSLARLRESNPEEDLEQPADRREQDERHTKEHPIPEKHRPKWAWWS